MSRVFIVQETVRKNANDELIPAFDLTPAAAFGELITLLPRGSSVMLNAGVVKQQLRAKLRDFSDDDYLLPVGDPTSLGPAFFYAAQANRGRVKQLKWERPTQAYVVVGGEW